MPSLLVGSFSGGVLIASGLVLSGGEFSWGGIQLRHSNSGIGPVYVGLPNLSGTVVTLNSGGGQSSGGLADGMELNPGDSYFVPKSRLFLSGVQAISFAAPATSSGTRVYWEPL